MLGQWDAWVIIFIHVFPSLMVYTLYNTLQHQCINSVILINVVSIIIKATHIPWLISNFPCLPNKINSYIFPKGKIWFEYAVQQNHSYSTSKLIFKLTIFFSLGGGGHRNYYFLLEYTCMSIPECINQWKDMQAYTTYTVCVILCNSNNKFS